MAKPKIKLRAKVKGDVVMVKAILNHPMESGMRKDKSTGKKIPAHHITEVTCHHKDVLVFSTQWGTGISKNPYLSFHLKGLNKGDELQLAYVDNKGAGAAQKARIK